MDNFDFNFYKGKTVLVTGHTGFKGSWMCQMLLKLGATVIGYALEPPTTPSLFEICGFAGNNEHVYTDADTGSNLITEYGDIRDLAKLEEVFNRYQPDIVIHMAAQPIVRTSYLDPVGTYETNVMGTVNVLESVRRCKSVKSLVNVTTDKVYLNKEWQWGYRENEELNGYDPYSNSKSCSELVTSSYVNSFFNEEIKNGRHISVSTMRAGNVIGGGDFARDRIVPDMIRAVENGEVLKIRNPYSTRPYQHVLEPVAAYLMLAAKQYEDISYASNYNVGPDESDAWETGRIVSAFEDVWNSHYSMNDKRNALKWENCAEENAPHEANYLKLDCTKLKNTFGWKPVWNVETAIKKIAEWTDAYFTNSVDANRVMIKQIEEYLSLF